MMGDNSLHCPSEIKDAKLTQLWSQKPRHAGIIKRTIIKHEFYHLRNLISLYSYQGKSLVCRLQVEHSYKCIMQNYVNLGYFVGVTQMK